LGRATSVWEDDPATSDSRNDINLFAEQRFPHSIGLLYSTFTAWLGFRVNNGEYKVMGMAPYGEPKYVDKIHKVFDVDETGAFKLNMEYFDFHHSTTRSYSRKFIELFGVNRHPDREFFTMNTNPERSAERQAMDENQYYADIAASIQRVTEDTLIKICNHLYEKTGLTKLVFAGGVALNTKANWRLLNETPFEEIFIHPAAGDDGGAVGAALWVYHVLLGKPRRWKMPHSYWGKEYSNDEYRQFLDGNGIRYERYDDKLDKLAEMAADAMQNQNVIGLMQGRFEWGPRALGNRSILADPRGSEMKEIVNTKIKFREPFRPFAPVILRERSPEYFDYPQVAEHEAPRYMLMVAPIKEDKQDKIEAVNHEGTGRLQSIDRETNPFYYDVIKAFDDATGVPVVLNTSFNLRGEPIVNTPQNAFNTFRNSDIDWLIMGPYLVRKPL
jgi:carbamoyltransferase